MRKLLSLENFESKQHFETWLYTSYKVHKLDYIELEGKQVAIASYEELFRTDVRLTNPLDVMLQSVITKELEYRGGFTKFSSLDDSLWKNGLVTNEFTNVDLADYLDEHDLFEDIRIIDGLTVISISTIVVAKVKHCNMFMLRNTGTYTKTNPQFFSYDPLELFKHELRQIDFTLTTHSTTAEELALPSFNVVALQPGARFKCDYMSHSCVNLFGEHYCGCSVRDTELDEYVNIACCKNKFLVSSGRDKHRDIAKLDICYNENSIADFLLACYAKI